MTASETKLQRCISAYRRRFVVRKTDVLTATMGGGGYAYVTNATTGDKACYDVSAWRVRLLSRTSDVAARSALAKARGET